MTPLPQGLLQHRFLFYFDGKHSTITLHFIPPGPWDLTDVKAFCEVMSEWWSGPGIGPAPPAFYQYEAASLIQTIANFIPAGSSPPTRILFSFLRTVFGSQSSPATPQSACPCVRLTTAGDFPRRLGRLYFPGFSSSFLEGDSLNLIKPTTASDFTDTWNGLPAYLADAYAPGSPPQWVVWLRRRQTGGPLAMPVVAPVRQATLQSRQLRSMRLRLAGQAKYDVIPDTP